jgi:uncharacterized SAM-binding protein YcdF (DUF218 family)
MSEAYAIVVLGAAVRSDGPSPKLRARLDAAAAAFAAQCAPRIIVTGSGEAETMARYLIERGVPADRIEREPYALSTRGNAVRVARMLPAGAHILVVTQTAHLRRALALFRRVGVDAEGLAAGEPFGFYAAARERVAYVLYRLCGWV